MQQEHDLLTIRFCGDSGDGIQLLGEQLMTNVAMNQLEVRTLPDYPAEIRAPAGTVGGVSGIQLSISGHRIETAGDELDILVALNPAALVHSMSDLSSNAWVLMNSCQFTEKDWQKAKSSPEILKNLPASVQILSIPMNQLTLDALASLGLSNAMAKRAKNFFVLGMMLWLFELSFEQAKANIQEKFQKKPELKDANELAMAAGYHYGMTQDWQRPYFVKTHHQDTKPQRQINGAEAIGLALATLAHQTQQELFVSGYPITPSSVILHECARLSHFGVQLLQAEDEIAAICACLGAAFGGRLALTTTSGPGFDLKMEGLGLGIVSELPMVLLDVQRAGPSTGLPTKTSQSDLKQALYGRHGESPVPVIAASSPADCFATILEAFKIAVDFMTPVIVLLDAYLMNANEPWLIPQIDDIPKLSLDFYQEMAPFKRLSNGSRSWNPPGHPDYIHQLGGLEKQGDWGKVSYDAQNHQDMVDVRRQKIQNIQSVIAPLENLGKPSKTLVVTWGSTFGAMKTALEHLYEEGLDVAWIHLRHLSPFPSDLGDYLLSHEQVLVFELNSGQLCDEIRAHYQVDAKNITQYNGKPFSSPFILEKIKEYCHVHHAQ